MHGPLFYLENSLDGFLVVNITAYPVHCICGITDNSPAAEFVSNLLNTPWLRIVGINGNQHGLSLMVMRSGQNEASLMQSSKVSRPATGLNISISSLPNTCQLRIFQSQRYLQCRKFKLFSALNQ